MIFIGKGISGHMALEEAVKKMPNLLISANNSSSQDHKTLLAAYRKIDSYLEENRVKRPVVVLSDEYSSRFDVDVLNFLRSKQIYLFITPSDTTGVTPLLDGSNQSKTSPYRKTKSNLFASSQTITRKGFMIILANMWETWASMETVTFAGKRVGVSDEDLNVDWVQNDKFEQVSACTEASLVSQ